MSNIKYPLAEERCISLDDIEPDETQAESTLPLFIKPREAARILGIGINAVYDLCNSRRNGFPAVKVGNLHKINREMLIEWAKKMTDEGMPIA